MVTASILKRSIFLFISRLSLREGNGNTLLGDVHAMKICNDYPAFLLHPIAVVFSDCAGEIDVLYFV